MSLSLQLVQLTFVLMLSCQGDDDLTHRHEGVKQNTLTLKK